MNPRALLAAFVAVATVTTIAMAGPAVAGTSAAAVSAPAPAVLRHVNLRGAFDRARLSTRTGPRAGVVPTIDAQVHRPAAAGRADIACSEPDCKLSYGGGAVQQSPRVYLVLWGPNWTSSSSAYQYLAAFYDGLGVTPDDTWSAITSQYGDSSGAPAFGSAVYAGALQDTSTPPDLVTPDDLAAEAAGAASYLGITDLGDAQVVVASQSGTCFSDGFAGSCGVPTTATTAYCGWHAMTTGGVAFTNLPYALDAGSECGENWINPGAAGTYDGFSTIAGHEYAETITDPDPPTGWIDMADAVSGGEIADKCAWGGTIFGRHDPAGDVTLSTGTFAMQSLWSNAAGGCVLASGPSLTISNPGTQTSTLGVAVDLSVPASGGSPGTLSFAAAGLPDGLAMSATTGQITGKPATTAGTWHPTVTVVDGTQSAHVTFTWLVSSKAAAVSGYAAKCLDDYRSRTAAGTKVDLWPCDQQARQRVTFEANGELRLGGKCVTDRGGATVLEPCSGASDQIWSRRASGEYVVRSGSRCLAVPGNSTANGTQLRLSACTDAKRERWSLP